MPANYVLLEKITVGAAGASSVTFSGIPQTGYTDLVVRVSARTTGSGTTDALGLYFNGVQSNRTRISLYGNGSSAASSTSTYRDVGSSPASGATASTFSNVEIYIPNYTSANYKSFNSDSVMENNATASDAGVIAGLWSSTAAITSLLFDCASSGLNFVQYSTFYLYGVAALGTTPVIVPYATGGDTIMTDGTYWYHTFVSSGTFTPAKALTADYLVVAGGGSGGAGIGGVGGAGGGGSGGLRSTVTATGGGGSLESALSLASGTGYTVTIGAGGASHSTGTAGSNGSDSVFSTITSTGGGRGGSSTTVVKTDGSSGGSGGGGQPTGGGPTAGGGAGTTNQGYAGGDGTSASPYGGGGGGGAGAVGTNAGVSLTGAGGNGVATSISGSSVTYAGGGGAGTYPVSGQTTGGVAGTGGGASGSGSTAVAGGNGSVNTGGGGGGGASGASTGNGGSNGGAGGSGLVIVRYAV